MVVMDYCERNLEKQINLFRKAKRKYKTGTLIIWMEQIVKSLIYLHGKNIIHRDVKPENILFQANGSPDPKNWTIILIDFGATKLLKENEKMNKFVGTPLYMAPEILENKEYGIKADVFSVGVVLYELLTLHGELEILEMRDLLPKSKKYLKQSLKGCDPVLTKLVKKCVTLNPKNRITMDELHTYLIHEKLKLISSARSLLLQQKSISNPDLKKRIVTMKSNKSGKYVSLRKNGHSKQTSTRAKFTIQYVNGSHDQVTLKTRFGTYLTAKKNGKMGLSPTHSGKNVIFTMVSKGTGTSTLTTHDGKHLTLSNQGNIVQQQNCSEFEKLEIVTPNLNGSLSLLQGLGKRMKKKKSFSLWRFIK